MQDKRSHPRVTVDVPVSCEPKDGSAFFVLKAANGEPILAPQITRRLIEKHLTAPDNSTEARRKIDALTETEREVLKLVGSGLSNTEIGEQLYMATGTVKAHISRILPKLQCANRVQAAIIAHDAGLTA